MAMENGILSMIADRMKLTRKLSPRLRLKITLLVLCGGANSRDILKTTICIRSDNIYASLYHSYICYYLVCSYCSCIMGPPRICPHCGVVLKDLCALYTHIIDKHDRRFCLYCEHEEGKPSRMRRHIRRRHNVIISLDEEPHRPAHVANRPVPSASQVPGYTPAGVVSQHHSYRPTPKQQCPKPSHKKRSTICTSTSGSGDTVSVPLQCVKKAMEASLVALLPPQQPFPPLTPPLRKGGILPLASDLNTPELPTLQPVSDDYLSDWDVTADFSIEEPVTVVSITPVADSRTVVATEPVPVPGNVERAALQLLSTMADGVDRPVPQLPPHPPSPPPSNPAVLPEVEVHLPPPVSSPPPEKKIKMSSSPVSTDHEDPLAHRPPPSSPLLQPLDLTVRPHYYSLSTVPHTRSPTHQAIVPPHYSPISEASDDQLISAGTGQSRRNLMCSCRCHCICGACCPCQCICEGRQVSYKVTRFWVML